MKENPEQKKCFPMFLEGVERDNWHELISQTQELAYLTGGQCSPSTKQT